MGVAGEVVEWGLRRIEHLLDETEALKDRSWNGPYDRAQDAFLLRGDAPTFLARRQMA